MVGHVVVVVHGSLRMRQPETESDPIDRRQLEWRMLGRAWTWGDQLEAFGAWPTIPAPAEDGA